MGILLKEHTSHKLTVTENRTLFETEREKYLFPFSNQTVEILPRTFKEERGKKYFCFKKHLTSEKEITLYSDYYVGVDWLTKDKSRYIQVEPKLNNKVLESFEKIFDKENENITDDEIEQLKQPIRLYIPDASESKPALAQYDVTTVIRRLERQANSDAGSTGAAQKILNELLKSELEAMAVKYNRLVKQTQRGDK